VADLGNLNSVLWLHCKDCGWRPPEDTTMEAVQLHFQVDHDADQVTLDLLPVCTCGAAMEHTATKPTGGGFKDYVRCASCGNAGFVRRDA
jgi:ribosomal protein S26